MSNDFEKYQREQEERFQRVTKEIPYHGLSTHEQKLVRLMFEIGFNEGVTYALRRM